MVAFAQDALMREAARWFMRMAHAAPDDPERGRFEAWLTTSPRHAQEYARFEEIWSDFDSTAGLERLTEALEDQRRAETGLRERQRKQRRDMLKGASTLGVFGVLGWFGLTSTHETPFEMARETRRRQWLDQPLPDGSRLVLAPESVVAVRYFEERREVQLQRGEVVFDVARDAHRPFIVRCAQARATVLGTHFAVSRLPDDAVRVSVIEGRVRLERDVDAADHAGTAEQRHLVLEAGQVAELSADGRTMPRRSTRRADDVLAWRQGSLVFDADTLPEVVQRLSRFTTRPLELDGPAHVFGAKSGVPRITAVVQVRDVDAFVRNLPRLAPVRLREQADVVRIEAAPGTRLAR